MVLGVRKEGATSPSPVVRLRRETEVRARDRPDTNVKGEWRNDRGQNRGSGGCKEEVVVVGSPEGRTCVLVPLDVHVPPDRRTATPRGSGPQRSFGDDTQCRTWSSPVVGLMGAVGTGNWTPSTRTGPEVLQSRKRFPNTLSSLFRDPEVPLRRPSSTRLDEAPIPTG